MGSRPSTGSRPSNGLTSVNGLSATSGLITTAAGRNTIAYIVRCALPAGHSISKAGYTFAGQLGVAPEWESGACTTDCQERVSACVLAHVNTSGQHISFWMDSDIASIGWGQSTDYPYQEGSFFGNIFIDYPKAYYCNGRDLDLGTVPGRLGTTQSGSPYVNPFYYSQALCAGNCTAANADGYKLCSTFKHVVTVYRNFDANTPYKICNRVTGRCLNVSGGSTANSAAVVQNSYNGASSMKWYITQISPKKYKLINVGSGKAMDITGARTVDTTPVIQYTYSGNANQLWALTTVPGQPGFYVLNPTSKTTSAVDIPWPGVGVEGGPAQEMTYGGADQQKWTILPAN